MTEYIRGEHQKDFTLLSNKTLRDSSLSWKARGLLAYLLSHAEGYHIRADNLHQFSSDGISATRSGIKELTQAGYIYFQKQQDSATKAWVAGHWIISEEASLPKGLRVSKPEDAKRTFSLSQTQPFAPLYKKIQKKEEQKKEEPLFSKTEHFVKKFYTIQRERFPNIVKNTPASQVVQACDTIDKLVRIDGYTLTQVIKAITWTLDDTFWATNVHSIVGLRGRAKNGNTKFQNILAQMGDNQQTSSAQEKFQQPEARRFPADNSAYGNMMGIRDVDFKG